ncbi:hypothetical protein [Phycicoccus flavus]|uniref:hypothetical protein n=1 Tax=Phycicoccus flavus TaxID=2502783 RepID=UPI000FEBE694|nr:hypothetical protein [Phycicoccus flavus]NHA67282.1 hypothetical protein [Phycicoccus flavus]
MTPARTWRRAAGGLVVLADVLVLLVAAAELPGLLPFSAPLLAAATFWALRRPGGSAGLALLALQALTLVVARSAPVTVTDWALAALSGTAVLLAHTCLSLLAAWAPGAGLPRATLRRWSGQAGVLAALGGAVAAVGALATATPQGWWAWTAAAALALLATTTALVGRSVSAR